MKYQEFHKELLKWKKEGIISDEQFDILDKRYKPKKVFIPRIHKNVSLQMILWFFALAIIILGTLSWVEQTITGESVFSVITLLIILIIVSLYFGDYVAGRPTRVLRYTGKAIIIIGCLLTTFLIFYTDVKLYKLYEIKLLGANSALFLLISFFILIPIAYKMREKVALAYSLIMFLLWFISQGKISTGEYLNVWLGMTFPTRLFLISLILIGIGYIHKHRVFNKIDPSNKFDHFHKTYYITGLLVMFIPTWMASMGNWLVNPLLPLRIESLVFVVLVMILSLACIYIGLIKANKIFLTFGIVFFILETYGKFYEVFWNRIDKLLFTVLSVLIWIGLALMTEYIIRNRDELKEELLKGNKG